MPMLLHIVGGYKQHKCHKKHNSAGQDLNATQDKTGQDIVSGGVIFLAFLVKRDCVAVCCNEASNIERDAT